jgi:hypothetical protein
MKQTQHTIIYGKHSCLVSSASLTLIFLTQRNVVVHSCLNLCVKNFLHLSFRVSSVATKRDEKHSSKNEQNSNYVTERVSIVVVDNAHFKVMPDIVSF